MLNLASLLLAHAKGRPDHPAIMDEEGVLVYAAAARRAFAYAGHLERLGIGSGDRVGLCLRDTAAHVLLHFAVAALGATIVPIDHRWTQAEAASLARGFSCKLVVVEPDSRHALQPSEAFDRAWGDETPITGPRTQDEDDRVVLSLSSGTTGRPTGALVSHRQLYERFVSQWVGIAIGSADRFLLATPLYFGGGRSFAMSMLVAGGTVILRPPPAGPDEIIAAIRAERATAAFLVPTQIARLLASWSEPGLAMPGLRRLVTSGSAMAPGERRRVIERLSPHLVDYYATSEGGGIAILPPDEQLDHGDTVGRPCFQVEVEVVDAADRPLPRGEAGRLRYRGPGVSTRLVDGAGATVAADPGGWFRPGDLARLLTSGHVQLVGRAKDVVIRAGVNIYPAEIEAVLAEHPGIAEAAAFGVPDPDLGEAVAAAIVARADFAFDENEIKSFIAARLAPYKVPKYVASVGKLPRNTNGKIVRASLPALLERALQGFIEPARADATAEPERRHQ